MLFGLIVELHLVVSIWKILNIPIAKCQMQNANERKDEETHAKTNKKIKCK